MKKGCAYTYTDRSNNWSYVIPAFIFPVRKDFCIIFYPSMLGSKLPGRKAFCDLILTKLQYGVLEFYE